MLKSLLASATFCTALIVAASASHANITVMNLQRSICEIQVVVGPNAPEGTIETLGQMDSDERRTFETNKLCVRRTVGEDTCGEYSEWKCCEAAEGEEGECLVP
ncbi:hypothetical protein PUV47_08125 [Pseudovibrio exalbescens]|uniref:hypothetical protein n=1 Tax=Pseudovibrio exalbescens TaxID=197461 RepID=UPI002366F74A|nr:hypothetical protein [Pseudovibrio exalbescens]MDD7909881.1 hypothetical protein [Pseudovibrio exalbescens]